MGERGDNKRNETCIPPRLVILFFNPFITYRRQDGSGHSGLYYVVQVTCKLLDPKSSESSATFIGKLINTLVIKVSGWKLPFKHLSILCFAKIS